MLRGLAHTLFDGAVEALAEPCDVLPHWPVERNCSVKLSGSRHIDFHDKYIKWVFVVG